MSIRTFLINVYVWIHKHLQISQFTLSLISIWVGKATFYKSSQHIFLLIMKNKKLFLKLDQLGITYCRICGSKLQIIKKLNKKCLTWQMTFLLLQLVDCIDTTNHCHRTGTVIKVDVDVVYCTRWKQTTRFVLVG